MFDAFVARVGGHRVPAAPQHHPSGWPLAEQGQGWLHDGMPCYRPPDFEKAARPFNRLALIPRQLVRQARPKKQRKPRRSKRRAPSLKGAA
ncbi:MAG: hypothetical protein WBO35_04325 [Candidatus Saccharimonadales bacterium]